MAQLATNMVETARMKLHKLRTYADDAQERADDFEKKYKIEVKRADETDLEIKDYLRKKVLLEDEIDKATDKIDDLTVKLRDSEQQLEESERQRKVADDRSMIYEDKIEIMGGQLLDSNLMSKEFDSKYDEVKRRNGILESQLEQAEERADSSEKRFKDVEEELKIVISNLTSLQISLEEAADKETKQEAEITKLKAALKEADTRGEFADRNTDKLEKTIEQLDTKISDLSDRYQSVILELDAATLEIKDA